MTARQARLELNRRIYCAVCPLDKAEKPDQPIQRPLGCCLCPRPSHPDEPSLNFILCPALAERLQPEVARDQHNCLRIRA